MLQTFKAGRFTVKSTAPNTVKSRDAGRHGATGRDADAERLHAAGVTCLELAYEIRSGQGWFVGQYSMIPYMECLEMIGVVLEAGVSVGRHHPGIVG